MIDPSTVGEPRLANEHTIDRRKAIRWPVQTRRWNWVYVIALIVTLSIVAFNIIRPITVLPRIAPSPGFALADSAGQPVTSEDQRGHFTLYSFSYLDCAGADCPQSLADIDALRQALSERLPADTPLSFVTITLNPERDTVERLSAVQADDAFFDWQLLTGEPLRTRYTVGGGFGVYYSEPEASTAASSGRITFDPRYVLVDQLGIMRAEYRTGTPDPDLLTRDVNYLINEAENSKGVARLGYEAAHLFLCYPR